MHLTERMVVVAGTMGELLNDLEMEVELRIHSYERSVTAFTLDYQIKQHIIFLGGDD